MTNPFNFYNQFSIGIIEDFIENCCQNFNELLKKGTVDVTKMKDIDFKAVCDTPDLQNTPNESRFLLYEPLANKNKTVFFSNLSDGWYTAIYNYTRLFYKNAYLPGFTTMKDHPEPAYFFRYFQSVDKEVKERTVYLIKENKWSFYEQSTPLEVENTANYLNSRKLNRLNNNIIISYLNNAGYDLLDESFYKTRNTIYLIKYR